MSTRSARTALFALLVVTVIWGWTFSWMKEAIDTGVAQLGAAMPLVVGLFMTVRFGMAALLMPSLDDSPSALYASGNTQAAWPEGVAHFLPRAPLRG